MRDQSLFAIEAVGLKKSFGATRAVDGIDLSVRRGAIFGVLGPNGAGKTTTVRMLATLLRPTGGSATVLGYDLVREPEKIRQRISLTGQFASIDEDLTGTENLVLLARLLGFPRARAKQRARDLLDAFDLGEAANRQVKAFSGGMRRRIDIAASILATPDLLFLDEPTTGLDPRSRNEVWEIVRALAAGGTTVVLTTQYLEEADQLADRIAVIDRGRVIPEGTSAELKASIGTGVLHIRLADPGDRATAMDQVTGTLGAVTLHKDSDPRVLVVQLPDPALAVPVLDRLRNAGLALSGFSLGQPSLDEVFFALTGHGAAADAPPNADTVPDAGAGDGDRTGGPS